MKRSKHDWNDLDTHMTIFLAWLERLRWFVGTSELIPTKLGPDKLKIKGVLSCLGGYMIRVEKFLELKNENGKILARTYSYSYHCEKNGKDVLRYDNSGHYQDHSDNHHKHIFNNCDHAIVEWVGEEGWPHLSDVVEEIFAAYEQDQKASQPVMESN